MREMSLTRCGNGGSETESCEDWEKKRWRFWGLGLRREWKKVCKVLDLENRDLAVAILSSPTSQIYHVDEALAEACACFAPNLSIYAVVPLALPWVTQKL